MIEAKSYHDATLVVALTLLTATWPDGRLGLSSWEHMAVAPPLARTTRPRSPPPSPSRP